MISFNELIGHTSIADIPLAHQHNLEELLKRVNIIREAWGKPMTVTSGYRTMQDHLRIYSEINAKRRREGKPEVHVPTFSQHLIGCAVDIYDPDLSITKWLKENDSSRLQAVGLWAEEGNTNWVHLQITPPASGKRWFYP